MQVVSAEEKSLPSMEWKQGGIYFVPSNKGKAVGWINSAKDSTQPESGQQPQQQQQQLGEGPVVLIIAKSPQWPQAKRKRKSLRLMMNRKMS
mmetsp:Transcript_17723/g.22952  ORF Transcript_17723/g.22952 Transcript_17723/m.22952 type:complete len:92 (+) Transcript_17723:513-788(+)